MYGTSTHSLSLMARLDTKIGTRSSLPSPPLPQALVPIASSRTSLALLSPLRTPVHRFSAQEHNLPSSKSRSQSQHRLQSALANHTSVPHVVKSSNIPGISRNMFEISTRAQRPFSSAGIVNKHRKTRVSSSYTVGWLTLPIFGLSTRYHPSRRSLTAVRFAKRRHTALTRT
jgi:hypothetical protein